MILIVIIVIIMIINYSWRIIWMITIYFDHLCMSIHYFAGTEISFGLCFVMITTLTTCTNIFLSFDFFAWSRQIVMTTSPRSSFSSSPSWTLYVIELQYSFWTPIQASNPVISVDSYNQLDERWTLYAGKRWKPNATPMYNAVSTFAL